MPYIDESLRKELDPAIEELIVHIEEQQEDDIDGIMNYTICRLLKGVYPDREYRYKMINRMMGVLACVTGEIYRRVVAPMENAAAERNGDIF